MIVEKQAFTPGTHRVIAQPGLAFVALRAVDGHTFVVAADTPEGIAQYLVECFIRAGEGPGMSHFVIYYFCRKIFGLGIGITADFHIAEAVVYKAGSPGGILWFTSADNIYIRAMCIAQILRKDFAIRLQALGKAQPDTVSCLAFDTNT